MADEKTLTQKFTTLRVMKQTPYLKFLHAAIRDKTQTRPKFVFYTDQLLRLLCEFALDSVPHKQNIVTTPTGNQFQGVSFVPICGVSVMRSGEAMETAIRTIMLDIKIGKVLVQHDAETKQRRLLYSKLPKDVVKHHVLILDPILASGSSALAVLKHLKEVGVKQEQISLVTMISCPEGISAILEKYPKITISTSMVDERLDKERFIIPGIGEFADRYFGT
uniref:uracil phosphoribosyltransferase n=1 Tax=Lotharella globosa TaxID=91324 RepID=A0A7S4DQ18_9EUKA